MNGRAYIRSHSFVYTAHYKQKKLDTPVGCLPLSFFSSTHHFNIQDCHCGEEDSNLFKSIIQLHG